jgi:hypothetical protein
MAPASAHGRAGNKFIEKYGMAEHAKWHLGQDDEESERAKSRYKFPYGDFSACTAAPCSPRNRAPANTNISTSSAPPRTCTDAGSYDAERWATPCACSVADRSRARLVAVDRRQCPRGNFPAAGFSADPLR